MSKKNDAHRVPLIHITKRSAIPTWRSLAIRAASILGALLFCGVVTILLTGQNPFKVYEMIFSASFSTPRKVWTLLQGIAMLLCVSLAVTPAFKMRFWNIGAEGQIMMGALMTAALMILLGNKLPAPVLLPLMLIAAIVGGALWGVIPALFKAQWGTNETLFTLMMNYVAFQLVSYFIVKNEMPKGSGNIGIINANTKAGWMPVIGDMDYLLNIVIVALLTAGMYIYLKYSKQGYEISVVGESQNTARYVGINVKKVIIRTMLISGALCGIAGFLLVSGTNHTITTTLTDGRGFTAIMVSWLAKFNPLYMVATSFLIVFLQRGASEIATNCGLNEAFSDILTGIILLFIIGSEFFIQYQVHFRGKKNGEDDAK